MRAAWYSRFGPAVDVLTIGEVETRNPKLGKAVLDMGDGG